MECRHGMMLVRNGYKRSCYLARTSVLTFRSFDCVGRTSHRAVVKYRVDSGIKLSEFQPEPCLLLSLRIS